MTFDQLVDRLVSLYDVGQSRAVDVANERLQRMVTESKSLRAIKSLGTTVANQTSYALASDIVGILKAKATYSTGQVNYEGTEAIETLWDIDSGDAEVVDTDSAYWITIEPDSDSSETTNNFRIFPAPAQSGVTVYGLVALQPATFSYGSASVLPIPLDTHENLLAGCKAELSDEEGDQAESAKFESVFQAGGEKLKRRVQSLGVGSGRHRIGVAGYDFLR